MLRKRSEVLRVATHLATFYIIPVFHQNEKLEKMRRFRFLSVLTEIFRVRFGTLSVLTEIFM